MLKKIFLQNILQKNSEPLSIDISSGGFTQEMNFGDFAMLVLPEGKV